jgi:hypothetical protein
MAADQERLRELQLHYRDLSDDELAELALERKQLTAFARPVFEDEVRRRGVFLLALIEHKHREQVVARFDAMSEDDLVTFLRAEPQLTPLEREVVLEQMLERELDPTTLPVLRGSLGVELAESAKPTPGTAQ